MKPILCPFCRKHTVARDVPTWPFCSERCKLLDLGKWAREDYRVAGEKLDEKAKSSHNDDDDDTSELQ